MPTPVEIVQAQLEAYNSRDIDGLLAAYAPHARQYAWPQVLLAEGHKQIRPRMASRLEDPALRAHLLHRLVSGNTVIDHEHVTRTEEDGPATFELVAIYEVEDGAIARATFIAGPRV